MADIEALLTALTLEEKAALTAGEDVFSLVAVERVGIPKVRITDGPAGAKWMSGVGIGGDPSTWIPCESAIGATWDPGLAHRLAEVVAREAKDRGCRGLLAPTVNLHRSPLAGRDFECFSEDPLLTGRLAAGYVRGVQAHGVFATVKHLVGNEAETERTSISSVIDERTLRELYLLPFEIAVRDGGALGIMTAYNRLNGTWVTEQPELLLGLLREEWGFQGLVMTDWHAVVNATESLGAGLDLEMPGPGRALGSNVVANVRSGLVDAADLDAAVRRLLTALDRLGVLDEATPPVAAQPPRPDDIDLVRSAAADATVLLTNDGLLPLDPASELRVAVIGDLGRRASMGGGGSAQLLPHRHASPLEALQEVLGTEAVSYERGCDINRAPARVGGPALPAPNGFSVAVHEGVGFQGNPVLTRVLEDLLFIYNPQFSAGYPEGPWSARVTGQVVPVSSGPHRLVLVNSSPARVFLDGRLVLDGTDREPPVLSADTSWLAAEDLFVDVDLREGVPVQLVVEYVHDGSPVGAFRVGVREGDAESLLERAASCAAAADVAVVVVGTSHEHESEGFDRSSFSLPAGQDELVRRVAAANPRTVVVVNAGTVVDLPWADDVAAVLQVWFGGQEMDRALADVLLGRAEPGGRLPVTVPFRVEHTPSHGNFPGENGEVRYGEGLFMGYRGFEQRAIAPRFPFGHGLSFTECELGEPHLTSRTFRSGEPLTVRVPVTNVGDRPGTEVVQLYVAPRSPRLARPLKELKGFGKVRLGPGEMQTVEMILDDRSFAYWDGGHPDYDTMRARVGSQVESPAVDLGIAPGWRLDPGEYEIHIGTSTERIVYRDMITVVDPA